MTSDLIHLWSRHNLRNGSTGRFDIESMHITGWIDCKIVSFILVIFTEKLSMKGFEEIIFIKTTKVEINKADTEMDRGSI